MLYSEYSIVEKGCRGSSGFARFGWQNWVQSIIHAGLSLAGVHVLGRVRPSLAPELPLTPSGWEGQYQLWKEVEPGLPSAYFSCLRALFRGVSGKVFVFVKVS